MHWIIQFDRKVVKKFKQIIEIWTFTLSRPILLSINKPNSECYLKMKFSIYHFFHVFIMWFIFKVVHISGRSNLSNKFFEKTSCFVPFSVVGFGINRVYFSIHSVWKFCRCSLLPSNFIGSMYRFISFNRWKISQF